MTDELYRSRPRVYEPLFVWRPGLKAHQIVPMIRTWWRVAFIMIVITSWLALVAIMWKELRTVPSAQELADARHVRPPLPADFLLNVAMSGAEMIFCTLMMWPWWRRWYGWRALLAMAALAVWFLYTVPLDLNQMEFQHRRWLALLILSLLGVSVGTLITATLRLCRPGTRC